ncbi:hypothetical protein OQJ13_14370 [Legionella sp. PATHC035]|uniref:Uncharacterized protein n=1 Tax=Legionella cherrii TaxID=28084 RepID=A0A0W0S6R2_9GAMM|nr:MULTISPECIES: hypothetical protein [Legionella]KTC79111.1 hypothetical protein Lche_1131 [Legionella cherrii]MCW8410161.1 hypothetical protein [Legionella sp. PATHC035]
MDRRFFLITLGTMLTATVIAAPISSIVTLSGGGNVAPATSLSLSLSGLIPGVNYNVVCYIDTQNPFQYILLGSTLADSTSTITSYSLNGNYVMQDQLQVGQNLVVINGTFNSPSSSTINFTNLDQTNSFNLNNCFGIPQKVPSPSTIGDGL